MQWAITNPKLTDVGDAELAKDDAEQTNIDLFEKETEARIKFLEQARSSLHESFKALQAQEAKHQFVLSSYRNIASKNGEAAYAAAYLVGQIYLVDYQGPEKAVWDQFEEDFCGPRDTADALNDSRKKFETYKNDPLRRGIYAAEISNLYLQLANTFTNETVTQIVPFSKDEIKVYKDLMKEAVLDAASRKKRAAVIKAAAQISKLALGIAGKLAV